MVAHLVRLKLAILGNGLRRSTWQVIGLVVAALYGLGVIGLLLVGLVALSLQDPELRRTVLVIGGSATVLGWWVVPLVAFGSDATLDPDRFARFPVPRRTLMLGMGLGALVGVPGAATVLAVLGAAGAWWRSPVALLVALVGGALGLAAAVVGSRALVTVLAPLTSARRFREVVMVLVLVPLFLLGPIMNALGRGIAFVGSGFADVADVLAWTPFGAPWALAADADDGAWLLLLARLAVAVGWVALLVLAWDRSLATALVRPRSSGPRSARSDGLGLFARMPQGQVGAVAARSLTYWLRDPRYASSIVLIPLVPVLLWFVAPGTLLMLALGPVAAYFLGWAISADIAYDSTAFWTHLAAPLDGVVDRAGRAAAVLLIGLPVVGGLSVMSVALVSRWDLVAPVVGVSLGVLLTSTGLASVLSARVVYPVPQPGGNPFSSPQGGSTAALLAQGVGSLVLMTLLLPLVVLSVVTLVTDSPVWAWVTAAVGLGLGTVYLVVGVRLGGRVYDRRGPDLMARLMSQR